MISKGYGVYNWRGDLYSIWSEGLYRNSTRLADFVDTSGPMYTFSSCLGETPKLFFHNGVKAYTYDYTNSVVEVTGIPTGLVPGSAYLDGTTYVLQKERSAIRGSGINDPATWDADNSLLAQIEPDDGVYLSKQMVYIIAFNEWSVEVFYDAGNATGSPLGPVQGAKISVGCRHPGTVAEIEGSIFWVAQARNGSVSVQLLDGLKAQVVSTPPVERLLQNANYDVAWAWTARMGGHKFYVVTLKNSNITLVYDMLSKQWAQWTDGDGNYLPVIASSFNAAGQPVLQGETDGFLHTLDTSQYTDNGVLIPFDLYTPNFDAGTRKKKYLHSLEIVADQTAGSTMTLRVSDDDYQTWSNPRTLDLGKYRPRLTGGGTFRRRAYHFHHSAQVPLRIQAVELQVEEGTL